MTEEQFREAFLKRKACMYLTDNGDWVKAKIQEYTEYTKGKIEAVLYVGLPKEVYLSRIEVPFDPDRLRIVQS